MKLNKFLASAIFAAGASVGAGQAGATTNVVFDFADSNVPTGGYYYSAAPYDLYSGGNDVSMTGVNFAGMSGIQANASAWHFAPNAPDGASAFIQSYQGTPGNGAPGTITFGLSNITSGTYVVSFSDAARQNYGGQETFTVTYGNEALGTYTVGGNRWTEHFTATFVANGSDLVFTGANSASYDASAAIANVSVTAVPELSTWLMMLAGFIGLGFVGSRRNQKAATFA